MKRLALFAVLVLWAAPSAAQLVEPNQIGVRMGHIHLAVRDVDAHKQFFTSVLGGTIVQNGPLELIQFPGVYVMLRKAEPTGPPAGAIVNHFGFIVKDMKAALARWKAANIPIEPTENPNEVYVVSPEGIRVEVYGEPALPTPVAMNHIHYYPLAADVAAIKTWYVKVFGANPGRRPCVGCISNPRMIEAGDMPGVNLSFSTQNTAPLPTKGRGIDHIGFEVADLDAFVASLAAKGIKIEAPVRQVPNTKRQDRVPDRSVGHLHRANRGPRAVVPGEGLAMGDGVPASECCSPAGPGAGIGELVRTAVGFGQARDTVSVTDGTGQEAGGTVTALSSSSLELVVAGSRRTFLESEARTIRQRRSGIPSRTERSGVWALAPPSV